MRFPLHFSMGNQKNWACPFRAAQITVFNLTPGVCYLAIGRRGNPSAGNADITMTPWSALTRQLEGETEFAINVLTAINPYPITPDVTVELFDTPQPAAIAQLNANLTPFVSSHPLLDGATDQDTVSHSPVKGDLIFANGSSPSLWDALSIGAVSLFLKVVGGLPAWANINWYDVGGLYDGTVPTTSNPGDAAATGGSAAAAHRDHLHGREAALDCARVIRKNTTQGLAGGLNVITFDTADFDANSIWDGATKFTPKKAGKYLFGGSLAYNNATTSASDAYLYVRKNGAAIEANGDFYGQAFAATDAANNRHYSTATLIAMNGTTDYVEFVVQNTSGNNVTMRTGAHFWASQQTPS